MLLTPNFLDYNNLIIFTKSSYQPEYQLLSQGTTTRAMRPGEVEGEYYYYIAMEEHMRLRNEVQIFEEVSLGTTKYTYCKSELKKLKSGGLGILETNPEGMRQIMKHLSDNRVKILSFGFDVDEETQRQCMKSRDTGISEEEMTTRINVNKGFDKILKEKDLFEHIYFNDKEKEYFPIDLYNAVNDIFQ
uniref:guanylate kinase-like n=1 Tax=Myxine glutinosa TaxID=7769 RepID=UPI00358E828D